MPIEIITTSDGSHSLRNSALDETYHSIHGARQESIHVFIKNGLDYFLEENPPKRDIHILEVGFGTGLNALLTLQRGQNLTQHLYYTSLETYPIPPETWRLLNYAQDADAAVGFEKLHEAPWDTDVEIGPDFTLHKINAALASVTLQASAYDVIYYDAFAPSKQPEMWTMDVLQKVISYLADGGIFVTYCAKGQLKRDLKALNLEIFTLEGPPGKKEMVRAKK